MRIHYLIALLTAMVVQAESPLVERAGVGRLDDALFVDARDSEAFAAGHIPGAANLDVDSLSETRDGVIGMLKTHADLLPLFAAAGLEPGKTLVVYSGFEDGADVKGATRLFWILEHSGFSGVRLLDGGLARWRAESGPVETGPSNVVSLPSTEQLAGLKPKARLVVDKAQLTAAMDRGTATVVDLRSKDEYTGLKKKDFVKHAGHVPGAKSKPATSFVEGQYFTFKSPEKIRAMIGSGAEAGKKPVITYCNSGRDATVGYVAYRIAGFSDVSVYDGSMAEWGNDASCPVAEGEE